MKSADLLEDDCIILILAYSLINKLLEKVDETLQNNKVLLSVNVESIRHITMKSKIILFV